MAEDGFIVLLKVFYQWNNPSDPILGIDYGYFIFQDRDDWRKHNASFFEQARPACQKWLDLTFPGKNNTLYLSPQTFKFLDHSIKEPFVDSDPIKMKSFPLVNLVHVPPFNNMYDISIDQ